MDATKDYQGFTQSITNTGNTTTERYKGFEEQVKMFAAGYKIGQTSEYGALTAIDIDPDEGPYWTVTLNWSNSSDGSGSSTPTGTSSGPTSSILNVRMLTMPLESKATYVTNWNYFLACLGDLSRPSWWATTKSLTVPTKGYLWVKTAGEVPRNKEDGKEWKILERPTKKGIDYYQLPTYELTEIAKHNSRNSARMGYIKKSWKNC